MSAKRERITRLYLPDCPWGPRCQEERRTLSVSSLRSMALGIGGIGASLLNASWCIVKKPWVGQPAHGNPWRSPHQTPPWLRASYESSSSSSHHSLFSLSLPPFSSFPLFFSYSYSAFSHLSQRKALTGVLIDFTALWKSLESGRLEGKSLRRRLTTRMLGYSL